VTPTKSERRLARARAPRRQPPAATRGRSSRRARAEQKHKGAQPATGKNSCDMVTGVTIKVAREAPLLAGTRAREARPKQQNF
jgi:hypothetical protein